MFLVHRIGDKVYYEMGHALAAVENKPEKKKEAADAFRTLATKYPDSEFAPKAKEKLQQLAPPATPKK